jgi:hypothetical protein
MDYVARIKLTEPLEKLVEEIAVSKKELTPIIDRFYKPKGKDLSFFNPKDTIIRKRKFLDRETLTQIKIKKQTSSYTDEKVQLRDLDGSEQWGKFLSNNEEWGELSSSSVEYMLEIEGQSVKILKEKLSFGKMLIVFGKFLKIEATSKELFEKTIKILGVSKSALIAKNSAVLLAEHITHLKNKAPI